MKRYSSHLVTESLLSVEQGHADITHRRYNTYHLILQNQCCYDVQVINKTTDSL